MRVSCSPENHTINYLTVNYNKVLVLLGWFHLLNIATVMQGLLAEAVLEVMVGVNVPAVETTSSATDPIGILLASVNDDRMVNPADGV